MQKNAARQTADKAGHDGPITTGSLNVTIGGFPAARMGDSLICKEHGSGVISEGSKTVTINGMPAARLGDKVICGKKALPPVNSPRPPQTNYATLVKNTNRDGSVKVKNPDEFQMSLLLASSKLADTDSDGKFDSANTTTVIEDFKLKKPFGNSTLNVKVGGTIGRSEMTAGTTNGHKGSAFGLGLSATGLSGNIGISAGSEKSGEYAEIEAKGTIGTAEAKAGSQIIDDESQHQYGFKAELGAEAAIAIAKGDIKLTAQSKYFKAKASISGSAGSIGANGGVGAMYDADDILLKIELTAKVAAVLGIGGDVEIEIGPFSSIVGEGSGNVTSGLGTVIIGG